MAMNRNCFLMSTFKIVNWLPINKVSGDTIRSFETGNTIIRQLSKGFVHAWIDLQLFWKYTVVESSRNAPERRSGSFFGDRNAIPVHFSVAFRCFSATGTPFLHTDPDYKRRTTDSSCAIYNLANI